eukprot:21736_1
MVTCSYIYNSNYFSNTLITNQMSISYFESDSISWNIIVVLFWSMYFIFTAYSITSLQFQQTWLLYDTPVPDQSKHSCKFIPKQNVACNFFLYWLLFLACIGFVVISVICNSLPGDNIFKIDEIMIQFIEHLIGFVLAFNTAVIVPNVVDYSYHFCCSTNIPFTIYISKYRAIVILVIRTCCIIIIPLIASVFISGNCGNHWTYYWKD